MDLDGYRRLLPELSEEEAREQYTHLPARYFELFDSAELRSYGKFLAELDDSSPYKTSSTEHEGGLIEICLVTFDTDFLLSFVSGTLSAAGLNIVSGDIFTYRQQDSGGPRRPQRGKPVRRRATAKLPKRKVVDVFRGRMPGPKAGPADIERLLEEVLSIVFSGGGPDSTERAKGRVAEELAARLSLRRETERPPQMYPVDVRVEEGEAGLTLLRVRSQDTPFFLYAFSTVLALHGISVEHVEIETRERDIEDLFYVRVPSGRGEGREQLSASLRLSVLFSKQFTYFLWNAPDPYGALRKFETLVREISLSGGEEAARSLVAEPAVLRRLSRILGASDFLWEDFIRLQYEHIVPLLSGERLSDDLDLSPEALEEELDRALAEAEDRAAAEQDRAAGEDRAAVKPKATGGDRAAWGGSRAAGGETPSRALEEKKRALNAFKDRLTYLIDLEHITEAEADFAFLSEHLSRIAELVVRRAFDIAWENLTGIYGVPRTVANLESEFAVAALGKFGGRALGYASDIELMVIYRDAGETEGPRRIDNAEFFSHLVKLAASLIESKREGIYRVDLRLRPHGGGGPLAVSRAQFTSYYRHEATSLERLALVRLRATAGSEDFGAQLERLRDEILYRGDSIDVEELIRLRKLQAEKYLSGEKQNVKYGAGGLIDLEYTIQILQVLEGADDRKLRTPYMHETFAGLSEKGSLDEQTLSRLEASYFFLRRLINGLRMLRGNALDLYLPLRGSAEFLHLSRRLGYRENEGVPAEEQLWIDFQAHTAAVRRFVEQRLGRHALSSAGSGSIADLLLSEEVSPEEVRRLFGDGGFAEPARAFRNFSALMERCPKRLGCIELALFAWDYLHRGPDPDMALNNWERFISAHPEPEELFEELYRQPKRLEILLRICGASRFLADMLMQDPNSFSLVTDPEKIHASMDYGDFFRELDEIRRSCEAADSLGWRRALREYRHRHILRIGSRDICYGAPLEEVVAELSGLADAVLECALRFRAAQTAQRICILAFGKLGGRELNYSSDIDLVVLYDDETGEDVGKQERKYIERSIRELRADIAEVTEDGRVFRIDFRLRPYGSSGELLFSPAQMRNYYMRTAMLWEYQALLKARPAAGNRETGRRLLEEIRAEAFRYIEPGEIVASVAEARALKDGRGDDSGAVSSELPPWARGPEEEEEPVNIKEGEGGIRDIEFLVQALQLIHCRTEPGLISGNTLEAIGLLRDGGHLNADQAEKLTVEYRFLRRVEHFLQLLEDRQEHRLPRGRRALVALGRRMRWTKLCSGDFSSRLSETLKEVRELFFELLELH